MKVAERSIGNGMNAALLTELNAIPVCEFNALLLRLLVGRIETTPLKLDTETAINLTHGSVAESALDIMWLRHL
jgi:hypothetical protein